jgi:hypothetical protein
MIYHITRGSPINEVCALGAQEQPAGFLFSEKMTSLDILDMYFDNFDDFSQHLVLINIYLSQINEIYFRGC